MAARGGLRTIQQTLTAGNDFTGVLPTTEVTSALGVEAYGEDAVGGMIDFNLGAPASVRSVELILGGQTFWTVHKQDVDGDEILILCGETEASFLTTEGDSFVMTDGQRLIIRTTGATGRLKARVSIQSFR